MEEDTREEKEGGKAEKEQLKLESMHFLHVQFCQFLLAAALKSNLVCLGRFHLHSIL